MKIKSYQFGELKEEYMTINKNPYREVEKFVTVDLEWDEVCFIRSAVGFIPSTNYKFQSELKSNLEKIFERMEKMDYAKNSEYHQGKNC